LGVGNLDQKRERIKCSVPRTIDEYRNNKVKYAFDKIKDRSKDNPKRSIAYVKGILRMRVKK